MLSYLDSLPWSVKIPFIVAAVTVYVAFVVFSVQLCAFNDRPVKKKDTDAGKVRAPEPDGMHRG